MSQIGHAAKADGLHEQVTGERRDGPSEMPARERLSATAKERSAIGVFVDARHTALQAQDLKAKWRRFRYSRLYAG